MKNFLDQVVSQGYKTPVKAQDLKQQKSTITEKNSDTILQTVPAKKTDGKKYIYGNKTKQSKAPQDANKSEVKDIKAQLQIETQKYIDNKVPQNVTVSNISIQNQSSDKQKSQNLAQSSSIDRSKYGRQQQTQNLKQQQKPIHSQSNPQKSHFNRKPAHNISRHGLQHHQKTLIQQKVVYTKIVQTTPAQPVKRIGEYKQIEPIANNQEKSQQKVSVVQNKSQFQPNVYSPTNKNNSNIKFSVNQSPLNSSRRLKINVQPANTIKLIQQIPKVRSNAIILCIRKLYVKNMQNAYSQLCNTSKNSIKKSNTLAKLVICSVICISKSYFRSIQRQFFKKAKAKLDKALFDQLKMQGKVQSVVTRKSKQALCNLIELKFRTILRNCFTSMKRMSDKRQLLLKGFSVLSFLETRKLKQNYSVLRINANRKAVLRQILMNSLHRIASGYLMRIKKAAFQKLIKANLSDLNKAANIKFKGKASGMGQNEQSISPHKYQFDINPISQNKIPQAKDDSPYRSNDVFQPNQKIVQVLRKKVDDSKSQFQAQKKSLEQFLRNLRVQIKQNQQHVMNLNEDNKRLKSQSQKFRVPHGQLQSDSFKDREDGYLLKLTQIYKDIFKRSEHPAQMVSIRNIIDVHEIQFQSFEQDSCVLCWNILKQISDLKRKINSIEGVQRHRKTALIVQQQRKAIENLVRSYVKERYLWEWVRQSINNVA